LPPLPARRSCTPVCQMLQEPVATPLLQQRPVAGCSSGAAPTASSSGDALATSSAWGLTQASHSRSGAGVARPQIAHQHQPNRQQAPLQLAHSLHRSVAGRAGGGGGSGVQGCGAARAAADGRGTFVELEAADAVMRYYYYVEAGIDPAHVAPYRCGPCSHGRESSVLTSWAVCASAVLSLYRPSGAACPGEASWSVTLERKSSAVLQHELKSVYGHAQAVS
jgi:hypothetical protein